MEIWIYEYQPTWPAEFESIKAELVHDLNLRNISYLSIEHIGSTAVAGMIGKLVIDVMIVIPAADFNTGTLGQFEEALSWGEKQSGYHYIGNGGVQDRWSFKLGPGIEPVRHVYVCSEGSLPMRNYLALRDTLRDDPELREEYGKVKLELALSQYHNIMQYATLKNDIIRKILKKGGWSDQEVDEKEAQCVKDWPREFEI